MTNLDTTAPGPVTFWPALLVTGLVNLSIGIAAVAWPQETITVIVILFGIQLIAAGVIRIVATLTGAVAGTPVLHLMGGVIGVVVGLLVMQEPLRTVEIVVTILGVFWVFWGLIGLTAAFGEKLDAGRSMLVIDALLSLGVGVALLVWPAPTVAAVSVLIGFFLIVGGLAAVGLSVAMWQQQPAAAP